MPKTAALILAAGAASRFGSLKQLAPIQGKPMVQHAIDSANRVLPGEVYLVLGNQAELIAPRIVDATCLINPDWREGLGNSLAYGARQLVDEYDALLVLLADQPLIHSQQLASLLALVDGRECACSVYGQRRGVPAVFTDKYFTALCQLRGDKGAKRLLESISTGIAELPLAQAAFDIDRPEDLETLAAERSRSR